MKCIVLKLNQAFSTMKRNQDDDLKYTGALQHTMSRN